MKLAKLIIREAQHQDLGAIVRVIADDSFGAREVAEDPLPQAYRDAFDAIQDRPDHQLLIGEIEGRIVATAQVTFLPGLAHQGAWRAQIESVHVASDLRNRGIGKRLMEEAISRARARGCRIVQLTSNKARNNAHRFYESLGFVTSHQGMKLDITPRSGINEVSAAD
jgi:ribosomal protein S18 acetylase RimI-like enzyme